MLQQACIQQGEVSEGLNISPHSITNRLFYCVLSVTRQEGVEITEMKQCGAVLWFWLAAALSVADGETRPIPSIIYQMFLFDFYVDIYLFILINNVTLLIGNIQLRCTVYSAIILVRNEAVVLFGFVF